MGEEPVSNYPYETSVLTKIGIGKHPRKSNLATEFWRLRRRLGTLALILVP